MNDEPLIIQKGNRKAIVDGQHVSLLRTHNKKKDTGVWPETPVPDEMERLLAANMWVMRGYIELPGVGKH